MDSMMILIEVFPVCLQYPPTESKILFSSQTCLNKTQLFLEIRKDDPEIKSRRVCQLTGQVVNYSESLWNMNTVSWSNKSNKSNRIHTNHIASKEQCEHVYPKRKATHKTLLAYIFSWFLFWNQNWCDCKKMFLKFSLLFNIKL